MGRKATPHFPVAQAWSITRGPLPWLDPDLSLFLVLLILFIVSIFLLSLLSVRISGPPGRMRSRGQTEPGARTIQIKMRITMRKRFRKKTKIRIRREAGVASRSLRLAQVFDPAACQPQDSSRTTTRTCGLRRSVRVESSKRAPRCPASRKWAQSVFRADRLCLTTCEGNDEYLSSACRHRRVRLARLQVVPSRTCSLIAGLRIASPELAAQSHRVA